MLIDLAEVGAFEVINPQIYRLGFFHEWLYWWAQYRLKRLAPRDHAMQLAVATFCRGHEVKDGTDRAVLRHDWCNSVSLMGVMLRILIGDSRVEQSTQYSICLRAWHAQRLWKSIIEAVRIDDRILLLFAWKKKCKYIASVGVFFNLFVLFPFLVPLRHWTSCRSIELQSYLT